MKVTFELGNPGSSLQIELIRGYSGKMYPFVNHRDGRGSRLEFDGSREEYLTLMRDLLKPQRFIPIYVIPAAEEPVAPAPPLVDPCPTCAGARVTVTAFYPGNADEVVCPSCQRDELRAQRLREDLAQDRRVAEKLTPERQAAPGTKRKAPKKKGTGRAHQ